jgi:hypothetical protein
MHQHIAQLPSLVDGARGRRGDMRRDTPRGRELSEELSDTLCITRDDGVDF